MILEREQLYLLELWSLPPVPSVSLLPGEGGSLPWASALRPPKMIKAASCNLIICLVKLLPSFLLISLEWFFSCKEVKSWAFHEKHFIFFLFFLLPEGWLYGARQLLLLFTGNFLHFLPKKAILILILVLMLHCGGVVKHKKGIRSDPRSRFCTTNGEPLCAPQPAKGPGKGFIDS